MAFGAAIHPAFTQRSINGAQTTIAVSGIVATLISLSIDIGEHIALRKLSI